jgi:hypothetical protein
MGLGFLNPLNWRSDNPGGLESGMTSGGIGQGMSLDRAARAREFRDVDPSGDLRGQAGLAGAFADRGEAGFGRRGGQADQTADYLGRVMRGEESVSREQLRQGLGQNVAAQQAMAAGARPGNAAMAARTAAMQAGRLGAGLSGQQAMAGIAERQAAAGQLGGLQTALRQQDLQAALGGRGLGLQGLGTYENARTNRFGAMMGVPTTGEQLLGLGAGLAGAFGMG